MTSIVAAKSHVNLRTEFADPPPPPLDLSHLSLSSASEKRVDLPAEPVVPTGNPPRTLIEWAVLILNTSDPTLKVRAEA